MLQTVPPGRFDETCGVTDHALMAHEGVIKPDDILELLRQRPFQPFRIHLSDGSGHDVSHPEQALVFPGRVLVAVPSDRKPGLMQDLHYCSILHITRLELLAEAG